MSVDLAIECLCGAIAQTVTARSPSNESSATGSQSATSTIPIVLCHCNTCRHSSGELCTSYCPIDPPAAESTNDTSAALAVYNSSANVTRYFCRTCGCHVFRRRRGSDDSKSEGVADEAVQWQVATGVIVDEMDNTAAAAAAESAVSPTLTTLAYVRHDHVSDTGDGGLANWISSIDNQPMAGLPLDDATYTTAASSPGPSADIGPVDITAACHCGTVRFSVRHPDRNPASSRQPHSGFCDLLLPFVTSSPDVVANPGDEKWWLVQSSGASPASLQTRYLAGTCACRSCRLASGFEIQTWAFVPRANIILSSQAPRTLDFSDPGLDRHRHLAAYSSSPGVERNFCPCCGATVFWHNVWRPDLVDVSVGLFHQADHASRAESVLSWCTTRVSFAEESVRGRRGRAALRAAGLVASLEAGMKASGVCHKQQSDLHG